MGHERSRRLGAGAYARHGRTALLARTRLAAAADGEPFAVLDRGVGTPLRPQQALGGEPPGVGGDPARIGAAVGARRQTRPVAGHALPGAGGAQQPRPLPAHGRRLRRTSLDHTAGRRVLPSLAPSQWGSARTPAECAEVVRQNTSAIPHSGASPEPDHHPRTTGAGASAIATAAPRHRAAQDPTRDRTADRTPTTHPRGARNQPC